MIEQFELQNRGLQIEGKFGIKLRSRLMGIADVSQLTVVDGVMDGKKITGDSQRSYFSPDAIPALGVDELLEFSERLSQAIEAMLFVRGPVSLKDSYVNGIGGRDIESLVRIGSSLAVDKDGSSGVVSRLVFGGTKDMSLRGLSYLLPPLLMMENMRAKGINVPQLQVIFANNISSRLNDHLEYADTVEQSRRFTDVAQSYVEEYFPEQLERVAFFEDAPLERGSTIRNELVRVARVADDEFSDETKKTLNGKGNNQSKRLNKFYGAAHVLMHDISLPGIIVPVLSNQPAAVSPAAIISFGGNQEKDFYRVRHELKKHLGEEYNSLDTLQYFTRHKVPPYYMSRDGDASLGEVLAGITPDVNSLPRTARVDFEFLHSITSVRGSKDFGDFLALQSGGNIT